VRRGRGRGVGTWHKSKRIEGAPWLCNACYWREVRTSRFFPLLSRERERATFSATVRLWLTARRSRFPFFAAHRNLDRGGDDVRQVRVVQGQQLAQLPDVPGGKVCAACYKRDWRQDNRTSKKKKK